MLHTMIVHFEKSAARLSKIKESDEETLSRVNFIYGGIIETFEIYGDFLNKIIIENIEDFEDDQDLKNLFLWILAYSRNWQIKEIYNIKNEPSKAIKKDLKTIRSFEEMILNRFNNILKSKTSAKEHPHHKILIDRLLKSIKELHDDLDHKNFEIFSKESYYPPIPTTKEELKDILYTIVKKYNIVGASNSIKQLVDNIPKRYEIQKHPETNIAAISLFKRKHNTK